MWDKLNNAIPKDIGKTLLFNEMTAFPLNLCISCGGSGRLKAMQSMSVIGGGSVRGPDTTTECNFCNGTGRN